MFKLMLCILAVAHAVPLPQPQFFNYEPYSFNLNQDQFRSDQFTQNRNSAGNSFGYALQPVQASFVAPFASPFNSGQQGNSFNSAPQGNSFNSAQQGNSFNSPPRGNSFNSAPVAQYSLHAIPLAAFPAVPIAAVNVPNPPIKYNNNHAPVEVQRINLQPVVREKKYEVRQPIVNAFEVRQPIVHSIRYVQPQPNLYNRLDFDNDRYDFDDDEYRVTYSVQPQPSVMTYSVRSPTRSYNAEPATLSHSVQPRPTFYKRSSPANFEEEDQELEEENQSGEAFRPNGSNSPRVTYRANVENEESGEAEAAEEEEE